MSRFSSFFDALSDKKARFLAEKQVVNDLIFDFYFNALQGKNHFDAVVISGGNSGNSADVAEGAGQDVIAIKVRPIDIQGLALPDPCSEACKGKSESYRAYLYALHPTAYSDPNNAETQTTAPGFGSIVKCYFEDRKRFRQLRWTSEGASTGGNYNFACGKAGSMIGNFGGGVSLLGEFTETDKLNDRATELFKEELTKQFNEKSLAITFTNTRRSVSKQIELMEKKWDNSNVGDREIKKLYSKEVYTAFKTWKNNKTFATELALTGILKSSAGHVAGLAVDIRTKDKTDAQMKLAIEAVEHAGGDPLLEPVSSGCWEKGGKSPTPIRQKDNIPAQGKCSFEHIHVKTPQKYIDMAKNEQEQQPA